MVATLDLSTLLDGAEILERTPLDLGTHPKEVVRVRAGGRELRLLCKYGATEAHVDGGHRGGVEYELEVYRRVLVPLGLAGDGLFVAAIDDPPVLAVAYMDDVEYAARSRDARSMPAAARWAARLHRLTEPRVAAGELDFLPRYSSGYYEAWAEQTVELARPFQRELPWVEALCSAFGELAMELAATPACVAHGEYYPRNVLVRGEDVYPVDWETAVAAPGELDIASLVDGWPPADRAAFVQEYRRTRWPDGAPAAFPRRLAAAGVYWHLRWLGAAGEWDRDPSPRWRFAELHHLGSQLGLV